MSRFAVPLMIAVACGPAPPPAVAPAAVAMPPEAMPPEAMPIDAGLPSVVAAAGQVGVQLAGQPRIEVPILDVRRSPGGHVIVFEPGPPGVIGHDATIRVRAPQVAEGVPPARLRDARSRRVHVEVALRHDLILAGLELEVIAGGGPAWHPQPPPPPEGVISRVEWNGELSVVIFDLGQDDGVVHGAGGTVIDAAGQPVTGGALRVIKVTRRLAVATVKLPAAQVERAGHVRLDPEP